MNRIYSFFPQTLIPHYQTSVNELEEGNLHHHQIVGRLLLLLGRTNCDVILREMVVKELDATLSHEEYILYASQLLQATKWEVFDNNALIRLLLRQAIEYEDFAYVLYWQLQVSPVKVFRF